MSIALQASILATHLLADFFLQSQSDAVNKHKLRGSFARHIITYSAAFIPLTISAVGFNWIQVFIISFIYIGGVHGLVDAITSQTNKYFYSKGDMYHFFCSVGVDQFLHTMHLLILLEYLAPK